MNAGILLMIAYWVIFTVRKHFTPKLAAATKANTYDLNRGDPEAKRALRAADWAETALVVLLAAWLFFLIGTVLTGTLVVFGYPV